MRSKPRRRDEALLWLRANKYNLGALTGQDTRALIAIADCWELYFGSDTDGRLAALAAVAALLRGMQPKCWYLAKKVIPAIGDWSHEEELWGQLVDLEPSLARDFIGGAS